MRYYQQHWDDVYTNNERTNLGWYEEISEPSLDLISRCNLNNTDQILDVGTGTTTLLIDLIKQGYQNISALDISQVALEKAKQNLNPNELEKINWICDDITDPLQLNITKQVDLWHDRTVLHFLTEVSDQNGYLRTLKEIVKIGGFVIIAVYSKDGAKKCSGLNVINYDHYMISKFLGADFRLLSHFPYSYIQPSGNERPFIYTLFQRMSK